jgi:hypothetical protein
VTHSGVKYRSFAQSGGKVVQEAMELVMQVAQEALAFLRSLIFSDQEEICNILIGTNWLRKASFAIDTIIWPFSTGPGFEMMDKALELGINFFDTPMFTGGKR